tara:strand:- start:113 stop:595 length:483 start_codon:yes stop_codon:yes gene_type:complete
MPNIVDAATATTLDAFLGKDIRDICGTGFEDARVNHCAHFVGHALSINVGMVCGSMKYETRGEGASIRVDEIYNACPIRGAWGDLPKGTERCLAFVTLPSNVAEGTMGSHPRKHVGVYIDGSIWHYSNSGDKVVKHAPEAWLLLFKGVYGDATCMYHGIL